MTASQHAANPFLSQKGATSCPHTVWAAAYSIFMCDISEV